MDIAVPGLPEVLTFAGASIVVAVIFQAIKAAWQPTDAALKRFGPLLSLGVGIVVVVPFAAYQGADLVAGALVGLMAGASASGLYDSAKAATRLT